MWVPVAVRRVANCYTPFTYFTLLYHKLLNCVRDSFDSSGVSTWLVSGCRQTASCVTGAESVRRQRSLMSCACISTNIFIKLLNFSYSCSAKVISVVANHRPCLQLKPAALPALHQQPDTTGRCERPTARHQLLTSTAPCHVLTRDHKVLPANYIFIYTWNEPYFAAAEHHTFRPILISHPIPLRAAGWGPRWLAYIPRRFDHPSTDLVWKPRRNLDEW